MNPWVMSTDEFEKLQALNTEIGDSLPTPSQLDSAQKIVATLYDERDWASNSTHLIVTFITDAMDQDLDPAFDPLITCNTILAEMYSSSLRRYSARIVQMILRLSFPSDMHKIEFVSTNPHQMDIFARIAFRLSTFLFFGRDEIRHYASYVVQRRNGEALRYALEGCDLLNFGSALGHHFWSEADGRDPDENPVDLTNRCDPDENPVDFFTQLMHTIAVIAAAILYDFAAIEFIDMVLAGGPPDLTPHNSEFWAVKNLRRVRQLQQEVKSIRWEPQEFIFPRLQKICQDELLRPLCPLFLPKDVDLEEVRNFLEDHLLDKHILFLSDLFEDITMAWAISGLSPFDGFAFGWTSWENVDPETQHRMFGAVLAAAQHPLNRDGTSKLVLIEQLWSSHLFWRESWNQSHESPLIYGIQSACLPLLIESLELYHAAAELQSKNGISFDTIDSKKILVAVREELERHTPVDEEHTGGMSNNEKENVEEDAVIHTGDEP
ncbi:hypothetical protein B0H11DRAFT_2280578 [Mycena galericulata]|nr:hypothetical protein B0H11DRAFT_2280578 [Mycena galericulata]